MNLLNLTIISALLSGSAYASSTRQESRSERRQERQASRQETRSDRKQERQDFRAEKRSDRQGFREERKSDRQGFRESTRECAHASSHTWNTLGNLLPLSEGQSACLHPRGGAFEAPVAHGHPHGPGIYRA